jgi:hypothetical protein
MNCIEAGKMGIIQNKNPNVKWLNCRYCGKNNPAKEMVCHSCGRLLMVTPREVYETEALEETRDIFLTHEMFSDDTLLKLHVAETGEVYEIRPQDQDDEIVIGRISTTATLVPDIDLSMAGAKRGVSRLHLSLRYDPDHRTINILDMGSANGSYINGQRLHPHEIRILRHGDELRLGKLVLNVSFVRPQ